jgi:hypothetical protein
MLLLGLVLVPVPVLLLLLTLAARAACTVGCKLSRNPGMGMASDTCLQVQQQPNSSKPNSQRRLQQINMHGREPPNKCSPAPAAQNLWTLQTERRPVQAAQQQLQ